MKNLSEDTLSLMEMRNVRILTQFDPSISKEYTYGKIAILYIYENIRIEESKIQN